MDVGVLFLKVRVFTLIFLLIVSTELAKICYANEKNLPQVSSKSAIAIEWMTGKILFKKTRI